MLSIESECLSRMIFLGESSLRRAAAEYMEHDHAERLRQGVGNERLTVGEMTQRLGPVACHQRLGGLRKSHGRAA